MTPNQQFELLLQTERHKELVIGIVSAVFTAVAVGVPTFLLFWQERKRNVEQVIVEPLVPYDITLANPRRIPEKDHFGNRIDITVRNVSHFPISIEAVGFDIGGKVVRVNHLWTESRMIRNPDYHGGNGRPYIADDTYDALRLEPMSSRRIKVLDPQDRQAIVAALLEASDTQGKTIEEVLKDVVALCSLESGAYFTSHRLPAWLREFMDTLKEMQENS